MKILKGTTKAVWGLHTRIRKNVKGESLVLWRGREVLKP